MSLFCRRRPRPLLTKKGSRIYAIGDVHGRYDLLSLLFAIIHDHLAHADPQPESIQIVLLGDIIDRGPDSRECLDMIHRAQANESVLLLRGNHEDMMLQSAQANRGAIAAWLRHGGLATLKSFGIAPPAETEDAIDFADRLTDGVPAEIWKMLEGTTHSWTSGDYLFVHAGVRPAISLDAQDPTDLLSIREEFTHSEQWHGAMVVHGHTIADFVEFRPNRIACDTGAFRTGRLSCLCLDGAMQTVLST